MSATCSKCDSSLFGTSDGGWECPVCDWLPAFTAVHNLGFADPAELEETVRAMATMLHDLHAGWMHTEGCERYGCKVAPILARFPEVP